MRSSDNVFHLAIPTHDLDSAAEFYTKLGCKVARRYEDRVTINFFGDQVVCHLSPEGCDREVKMYPRHFGITFKDENEFDQTYIHAKEKNLKFFKEVFHRFTEKTEEHKTFFLVDPSNNLLEFKYYKESKMMY